MLDQIILITALEKWCPGELNSGRGGDVISLRTGDSVKTSQGASRGKGAPRGAVSCTGWRLKTNSFSLTRADLGALQRDNSLPKNWSVITPKYRSSSRDGVV